MGYVGARAKAWAIHFGGTRAYMVRDLLIDLQLRSYIDKYNIPPCFGNIGQIVKNDCPNPHTNPSTLILMCHIYHQRSKHKNASSDEKCGIQILMQTPNMRVSVSKGPAIMTSFLTSSMTKSLQKEY